MQRAITLAMQGRGAVEPNPMVGCVIVSNDPARGVIAEGYHAKFGGPHAEADALSHCDPSAVAVATIYVTLEPCCHTNKKTPPCVPRLIAAKPARVVVGAIDPNPQVAGRGVAQLREAGIAVVVLDLPEAKQLIAPFIAGMVHQRPYITLKWAQTADGAVAGAGGKRLAISGPAANAAVHQLRARCDAIVVGVSTAMADNPMLTARDVTALHPLRRVVLDPSLRIPLDSRLVASAAEYPLLVVALPGQNQQKADALAVRRIDIVTIPDDGHGRLDLSKTFNRLYDMRIQGHILVEAGPTLARAMLSANLVDRLWIISAPRILNEASAPKAPPAPADWPANARTLGEDRLTEYLNPHSEVFFDAAPSADFQMVE
jgi:diaminohydroxyphosphoribosylaminopyrimidine deaminase / 5-amino-6-(5-phosphoribosylamino)uracil reductase